MSNKEDADWFWKIRRLIKPLVQKFEESFKSI